MKTEKLGEVTRVPLDHCSSVTAVYSEGPKECGCDYSIRDDSKFKIVIEKINSGKFAGMFKVSVADCGGPLSNGCEASGVCGELYNANKKDLMKTKNKENTILQKPVVYFPLDKLKEVELAYDE